MKFSTLHGLTAAAIALSVSASVLADDNEGSGRECSEATLQGLYVFSASGFSIVAGVAQPRALVEFIRFNGDGILSNPAVTLSINGVITRGADLDRPELTRLHPIARAHSPSAHPGLRSTFTSPRAARGSHDFYGRSCSWTRRGPWRAARGRRARVALIQTRAAIP
jgi:hypothetical protein